VTCELCNSNPCHCENRMANITRENHYEEREYTKLIEQELTRYQAALWKVMDTVKFYADRSNWEPDDADTIAIQYDHGLQAREILEELTGDKPSVSQV
jgi:hypothetical protein